MNKEMAFVVPAEGMSVRMPNMVLLPAAGAWVERNNFWLRRISDGSVREATPPSANDGKPAAPAVNKRGKEA